MIAEAIKKAYPKATYVSVDLQTIRFTDPDKGLRYTYLTPRTAQQGIVQFDQGVEVEPFSVRLKNGQVTEAGRKGNKSSKSYNVDPEVQSAKGRKGGRVSKGIKLPGGEGVLHQEHPTALGTVPARIGGSPPPMTPFGRRREFGLRALVRSPSRLATEIHASVAESLSVCRPRIDFVQDW